MGKSRKHEPPVEFLAGRTYRFALDLRARGFDEFSIVHAGRAGGHAGHATEATVEMADPFGIHFRSAVAREFHEVDAAAWGIHLLAPQNVGGANRQAKAAVHALFDDLVRRRVVRVEGGCLVRVGRHFIHRKGGSWALTGPGAALPHSKDFRFLLQTARDSGCFLDRAAALPLSSGEAHLQHLPRRRWKALPRDDAAREESRCHVRTVHGAPAMKRGDPSRLLPA